MQTLKYNTRVPANVHHRRAASRVRSLATDWPSRLILEIDIRELLSGAVLHDEGGADIFDSPRRREAVVTVSQHKIIKGNRSYGSDQ